MSTTLTADQPAFDANSASYITADVDGSLVVVFQCASCLRCLGDSSSSPTAKPRQDQGRGTDDGARQDGRPDQAGDRQPRSVTTAGNQNDAAVVTLSKVSDNVVLMAEEMVTLSGSTYRYLKCECGKRIGRTYRDDTSSDQSPASAKVVVANRFCLDKKQLTGYQIGSMRLITELETRNVIRDDFEKLEQMIVVFDQRLETFNNRLSGITSVLKNERLAQAPGNLPKAPMTDERQSKQTTRNVGNKRARASSKEANSRLNKSPKKRRYEYLTNTESGSESGSEYAS